MRVIFDASVLLLLIAPSARAPATDEATLRQGSAKERLDHLIAVLDKQRARAIIPAPVLTEMLISSGPAAGGIPTVLEATRRFTIEPFNTKAAIECGMMLAERRHGGKRRAVPWAKVKFDHQIVAIARVAAADVIYSDDGEVRSLAEASGIKTYGIWDLAPPPIDPQGRLALDTPVDNPGNEMKVS